MLLEQRILDLQKDKGALIDKVRELKNEVARLTNENKILEQRILDLQKDKGALIDKVRELKEVIYERNNL